MTDTAAPKPRSPLWIKLVLGLSILLNLGLGGVLLGIATGGARDGSVMSAAIAALPQDSRRDLRRALRADWAELRGYSMPVWSGAARIWRKWASASARG